MPPTFLGRQSSLFTMPPSAGQASIMAIIHSWLAIIFAWLASILLHGFHFSRQAFHHLFHFHFHSAAV
jgi:hypothetical protein